MKEDVNRIINLGYKNFFEVRDGYVRLKNIDGQCVFLKNRRCSIYVCRPIGCRLYPAICDADADKVILDRECPCYEMFRLINSVKRNVKSTIKKLTNERKMI